MNSASTAEAPHDLLAPAISQDELVRNCVSLMQAAGEILLLRQETITRALTLFHRYQRDRTRGQLSPEEHIVRRNTTPKGGSVREVIIAAAEPDFSFTMAATCLFVSGKLSAVDCARKLGDIATVMYALQHRRAPLLLISPYYWEKKDEICVVEYELLKTLRFDTEVDLPYPYLFAYLEALEADRRLAQVAMNLCNDCHRSSVCISHAPSALAATSIYLAAQVVGVELPVSHQLAWHEAFGVGLDEILTISEKLISVLEVPPDPQAWQVDDEQPSDLSSMPPSDPQHA